MPSGASAGLSSLPSSFSSSEHKSDSSSSNSHALLPQPSSADPPRTTDQVIEFSVSSEELGSWRRRQQQTQTEPMPWPGRTRSLLRRYSPLVPPAALLIALVVLLVQDLADAHNGADSLDSSAKPVLQWKSCERENAASNAYNSSAQCATVALPLCYKDICETENANATILVSLKRIPALTTNDSSVSEKSVWFLPDRSDFQSREEAESQITLLYEQLQGDTDIYTLDLRGTGNSTALTCNASDGTPLQTAIFSRNDGVLDPSDVQACVRRLDELGYTNLSAFSLPSAARDVEEIIDQFHSDSQAVVYALGYGTLVARQLMQREVSQVVGYVLDGSLGGITSSEILYEATKSDEDFGEVSADFIAWCELDPSCSEKFSDTNSVTTLTSTLVEVYTRLDADISSKCSTILTDNIPKRNSATSATTPPSYVLRQLLALMMNDKILWPFIPVIAYRFHRCGSEDLILLARFVKISFEAKDVKGIPDLLYAIQMFSELWELPTPDQAELTERFTDATISAGQVYTQLQAFCLFTGYTVDACANTSANASSTLSYTTKPVNSNAAAFSSGTSVLLLSGAMDVTSPPKYASALFNAYSTDNTALLVAANGTHGVVQSAKLSNGTACARHVLASYVQNSGNLTAYDPSCMASLSTPSLVITSASSLLVLGVTDAYDGQLVISNSSDNSGGSVGVQTDSGSYENSGSESSREFNRRISALEASRRQYKAALIVVASLLGAVIIGSAGGFIYRRRRKQQLMSEEAMLRRMRGDDEENELDLMRSIYLLSSSSPSGGEHTVA
ncbi:putative hydrolase [Phytophthora citrophthora]|uniref:Hydrolase n=1 Tax=Phytophthora citrophthora TaxID=4793 RepID=A0AAD9LAY9_9STRA|nr:putative hydrolase [Phytophthora citrophthora]